MSQLPEALNFLRQAQEELAKVSTHTKTEAQAHGHAMAYIDLAYFRLITEMNSQQAEIRRALDALDGKQAVGR